jgi:uncharacterized protein (DUF885 family)
MRIYIWLFIFVLGGCNDLESNNPSSSNDASAGDVENMSFDSETHKLGHWLNDQWEQQLDFSPQRRTYLGSKKNYDLLDDYSFKGVKDQVAWLQSSVDFMEKNFDYEELTEDGKLSWEMWKYSLERAKSGVPFLRHRYLFGRGGIHASIANFMVNLHRVDEPEDMNAYLSRLGEIDRVLDEVLVEAKKNAEDGIRQPRFAYDFAIDEVKRVTMGFPFSTSDDIPNSPLWTDAQSKISNLLESNLIGEREAQSYRERVESILGNEVSGGYERVLTWLEADRQNATESAQGVWALPNGEDYYSYRLEQMTTLSLSAEEIHQIGLAEVARLLVEMEELKSLIGFDGDLNNFFEYIREDENNYYEDSDTGREMYLEDNYSYLEEINKKLPDYFGRLPKASLEIRRVEAFREQDGAAQHYRSGTPDGSRPGVYYSHMSDMSSLPKHQVEDVLYHEGNPGHHMQISIQQELEDVPLFRTQYRTTAFVEGWGLYAEKLAKEMGGFEDPMSDFGRLSGEIWRAIRLVVDTGIHAKAWTEEEAVEYFFNNSDSSAATIQSEIKRYFASPGQATAYKIGMISIQQARRNAEKLLGEKFDIKEFHDVILGAGALPLPLMHARVERWVENSL